MWEDRTSDAYWTPLYYPWDVDHWRSFEDSSYSSLVLVPIGPWANDYQPTHIRVTFSGTGLLDFRISAGLNFQRVVKIITGQDISITLATPYTIDFISLDAQYHVYDEFHVTKIEFLVDDSGGCHRKRRSFFRRGLGHDFPC